MEQKHFSEEELKGLEAKILAEQLTAQDIADVMVSVRKKYLNENEPRFGGMSKLWEYTNAINQYFNTLLLRPENTSHKREMQEQLLCLDLMALLSLRESRIKQPEPKKFRKAINKIKSLLSRILPKTRKNAQQFSEKSEKLSEYNRLKLTKYKTLFEQMRSYDWKNLHITYDEEQANKDAHELLSNLYNALQSTILTAMVSKVTVQYIIEKFD